MREGSRLTSTLSPIMRLLGNWLHVHVRFRVGIAFHLLLSQYARNLDSYGSVEYDYRWLRAVLLCSYEASHVTRLSRDVAPH